MNIELFDYNLPEDLIAQEPAKPRDHSRLLILDVQNKKIQHKHFYDLPDLLDKNDVLVLNETRVIPARLLGKKKTGGRVEVLLTKNVDNSTWQAMLGGRKLKIKDLIYFDSNLQARIIKQVDDKVREIKFNESGELLKRIIEQIGCTPIPPYIKVEDSREIRRSYQTVFAKVNGSVAAPTAGLHFTPKLLKQIKDRGVKIFKVTLHVGLGTFEPVTVKDITKHKIHPEWVSIDSKTAKALNALKAQGRNIIAIGTTTARALEAFSGGAGLSSGSRWVGIYIYPGYKFKFIDNLITNFHLPRSSLLFMVAALAGRKLILDTYQKAIRKKYRFYSFGDAMFIKLRA